MPLPRNLIAVLQAMVLALAGLGLGTGPAGAVDLQADASRAVWASHSATVQAEDKSDQAGRIDPDRGSGDNAGLAGPLAAFTAVSAAHAGPGVYLAEFLQPSRRTRTHPPTGPPLS